MNSGYFLSARIFGARDHNEIAEMCGKTAEPVFLTKNDEEI